MTNHDPMKPDPNSPDPRDPELEDENAWLRERYPAASADFVENTLARVMADRREIAEDAGKVDKIQFDPELLAHLQAPETSTGFVERVLAAVMAQRQHAQSKDHALEQLLSQYTVPEVSADFVRRTLTALGTRQRRRERNTVRPRQWALAWAAAAALLLALPFLFGPWPTAANEGPPTAVYTPVRFGGVMATGARLRGFRRADDLVTLAYLVSRPGEDSGPDVPEQGR